jgi:DNA-binding protein
LTGSKIQRTLALSTETKEISLEEINTSNNSVFEIHNDPAMQLALDAISIIGKYKEITLRAKGNSIPNAVTVANIITGTILKGNSKIHKVKVGSEPIQELGQMLSNIEIILRKI